MVLTPVLFSAGAVSLVLTLPATPPGNDGVWGRDRIKESSETGQSVGEGTRTVAKYVVIGKPRTCLDYLKYCKSMANESCWLYHCLTPDPSKKRSSTSSVLLRALVPNSAKRDQQEV